MAGNGFGERFRVTTFGESHGGGLGVVIDGCPAGHPFPHAAIAAQLARRRPGQSELTTQRREADEIELLAGVEPESQRTLGTPIAMLVRNRDHRSGHYGDLAELYRPSHADYTYDARFGLRAVGGGGRASARETVARVAAGALAEDLLAACFGVEIVAWVEQIDALRCPAMDEASIDRARVDRSPTRCPDPAVAEQMDAGIREARKQGDSLGGVVRCVIRNVPPGLGEPVFDKLSAALAGAMMSLPASRAFEIGEGFAAVTMRGSTHNDPFFMAEDRVRTRTNHSGGIQGGLSNGEAIRLAVAFKPVATIFKPQETVTRDGRSVTFVPRKGRHDPCVLPRAVPMVEAMAALVVMDHALRRLGARVGDLVAAAPGDERG
ncbi:chorismate synthase [Pseudenhygromyxa sp. WMMC2535]|uniref:chorismate synthase n=1 Tax=Pseudenhygromyxa sp. WMMC2535 TaxID=2712867 RepID=UPI001555E197|nr:chorismate synthase [Pseudenhygromyxa sp. WMMC2535]